MDHPRVQTRGFEDSDTPNTSTCGQPHERRYNIAHVIGEVLDTADVGSLRTIAEDQHRYMAIGKLVA